MRPLLIICITCLLLYTNLFVYSAWNLFFSVWWTGAYIASIAVPILGITFGTLISIRDVGTRHACAITTAQRSITGAIILTIFTYTQPLANVLVTIINSFGIVILLLLSLEWGRAQARMGATVATSVATEQVGWLIGYLNASREKLRNGHNLLPLSLRLQIYYLIVIPKFNMQACSFLEGFASGIDNIVTPIRAMV